jgi:transcriptional regulator with XRE-family HTH domain
LPEPRSRIDVARLYAALNGARNERELSWRQLAAEVGCSPSTMTRLANGYRPDVDAFMALVGWLRMPAEYFTVGDGADNGTTAEAKEPELLAQVGALLRARKDLGAEERAHLQEVFAAALRLNSAQRSERNA